MSHPEKPTNNASQSPTSGHGQVPGHTAEPSDVFRCVAEDAAELTTPQMMQMLSHLQRLNLSSHLGIGLAHQLNHPMSASVNYTQCCVKKLQDENFDRHELLGLMQLANQEAFRAAELITRLRRFVSQAVPRISTLNFNHKILEVVALLTPLCKEHDIELKLELHDDLPAFMGDRIQIEQIIFNLGLNAIQSLIDSQMSDPCVIIKSDLVDDKKQLVCHVMDNGPGLDVQIAPHLFKPFQTTRTHCLGLGLAMSKALCELHHGQLTVETQRTGGCIATLFLPVTRTAENVKNVS